MTRHARECVSNPANPGLSADLSLSGCRLHRQGSTISLSIRNMVREGKTHQIRSIFQHAAEVSRQIDVSLSSLVRKGDAAHEEPIKFCENPAESRGMGSRYP